MPAYLRGDMREVFVYHSRRNYEAADAFVASLRARADVGLVRQAASERWDGETLGDAVFHDGSSRALAWAHEQAGIPVELFTESVTQPEREPDPIEVAAPDPEPTWPAGYDHERAGSWYSVFAPDGEFIGKVQGEAAAIALATEHADA